MPGSVIVADARTPVGKLSGALKGFKAGAAGLCGAGQGDALTIHVPA